MDYRSASGSIIDYIGYETFCFGAYSCESADILMGYWMNCLGFASCAQGYSHGTVIHTHGVYAFHNATVLQKNRGRGTAGLMTCAAERCAAGATMTMVGELYSSSAYEFAGANLTSECSTIRMYGFFSGYGATLTCQSGCVCHVYCRGTGCAGLYIRETEGSTGTFVVFFSDDPQDDIPPIYTLSDFGTVPADTWLYGLDTGALAQTVEDDCNTLPGAQTFDDYRAVDYDTDVVQSVPGPVCCRSKDALYLSRIAISSTDSPLGCFGDACCVRATIHSLSQVLCVADQACEGAAINTTQGVYCAGYAACLSTKITAPTVYCTGETSCKQSTITSNGTLDILAMGEDSAKSMTIVCGAGDTCTVSCYRSDYACSDITTAGSGTVVFSYSMPTMSPTTNPTAQPSQAPPTSAPTSAPTSPSLPPTAAPTFSPSESPTQEPTAEPTRNPTDEPTSDPTIDPTSDPTIDPTQDPTVDPTIDPSFDPTAGPSRDPTSDPTVPPTNDPTADPTADPTSYPTADPSADPTKDPSMEPTSDPTDDPTADPTINPTQEPTVEPTLTPSKSPTRKPTLCKYAFDDEQSYEADAYLDSASNVSILPEIDSLAQRMNDTELTRIIVEDDSDRLSGLVSCNNKQTADICFIQFGCSLCASIYGVSNLVVNVR